VSLPEVPLLGVLPGTGGLTRVVDKRKVRRDRADIFCALSEGIRGRRAVEWRLVDALVPRSRFDESVDERAAALAAQSPRRPGPGVSLPALDPEISAEAIRYRHLTLRIDRHQRQARITVHGPADRPPDSAHALRRAGADIWALRVFRELDHALCHLRFNEETCGLLLLETRGDVEAVLAWDRALHDMRDDWFAGEILLHAARTLRRLDLTARSIFALVEPESCFAGSLLELALAADRTYALDDRQRPVQMATSPLNGGFFPMSHGFSRLRVRWLADPQRVQEILAGGPYTPEEAEAAGLVTVVADEIDYDDEVRVAIEERSSLSPDALTGMEASLRYPGTENMSSKVFGRLSAWQNWVFQRPNAVGDRGALKLYGRPERPRFDWGRT
ncbi:MAG: benzoyl-CoA-dihydrodiol lyase, partial [Candidatus Krumholzibacteriia bacterium]